MPRCELCHLRYDPESPADRSRHRRVHDRAVNGVPYRPAASDRVISEEGEFRVAVVTRDSPLAQRRRAVSAFRVASREMRYSGSGYTEQEPPEQDSHAFLLYRRSRLVGVFILARRTCWVEGIWDHEDPNGLAEVSGWRVRKRRREGEPLWSVDFMWIAPKHRQQHLGELILQSAARYLDTPTEDFSWLPPFTAFGKAFIRRVQPEAFRAAC